MSEHDIAMAQAEIAARDAKILELQAALAAALRERAEAVALLARENSIQHERDEP